MKPLRSAVTVCLVTAACGDAPLEVDSLSGRFDYTGLDSAGSQLLTGWLDLAVAQDGSIQGTWLIDWAPDADTTQVVGPQLGTGTLTGQLDNGQVWIDLNPAMSDNNVILTGTTSTAGPLPRLVGDWTHVTLGGPTVAGFFDAMRR